MIYVLIIIGVYVSVIAFFMNKRDNINITTLQGKLECKKINDTINLLTGFWIWKLLSKK